MHKLLAATPATRDQDHVPALVSAIPQIPDRTQAFQGRGASPLPAMLACARRLEAAGAGVIVIPCNTAHIWFQDLQAAIGIPVLHMVEAAMEEALSICGPPLRIGLLATEATLASGLYGKHARAPDGRAVEWILPTEREAGRCLSPGIAAVKAGRLDEGRDLLLRAACALHQRGAAAVVLGCTEIPVVLNDRNAPLPTIDATAALARRAVGWSLAARHRPETRAPGRNRSL